MNLQVKTTVRSSKAYKLACYDPVIRPQTRGCWIHRYTSYSRSPQMSKRGRSCVRSISPAFRFWHCIQSSVKEERFFGLMQSRDFCCRPGTPNRNPNLDPKSSPQHPTHRREHAKPHTQNLNYTSWVVRCTNLGVQSLVPKPVCFKRN